jgi:hypothetical protein
MLRRALILLSPAALTACRVDSREHVLATTNTQAAQRAISTRVFDTDDRPKVSRAYLRHCKIWASSWTVPIPSSGRFLQPGSARVGAVHGDRPPR